MIRVNTLPSRQPWILWVGSIGPLGRLPASGTVTVGVVGIPLYALSVHLSLPVFGAVLAAFALASVWLHTVGDRLLGEKDSRSLVWDELVGFLVAVALLDVFTWRLALVAFLVERAIDIVKVPPANWIERRWPAGWGVVGDDVVAGIYTAALLELLLHYAPAWLGAAG